VTPGNYTLWPSQKTPWCKDCKWPQYHVIRIFSVLFRANVSTHITYHRTTPWLIGFILGYFLHKYQHITSPRNHEEGRIRKITRHKVRAIATIITHCQYDRVCCLHSQQEHIATTIIYCQYHRVCCLQSQQEHNSELFCSIPQSLKVMYTLTP
jgi:hypothetical protein